MCGEVLTVFRGCAATAPAPPCDVKWKGPLLPSLGKACAAAAVAALLYVWAPPYFPQGVPCAEKPVRGHDSDTLAVARRQMLWFPNFERPPRPRPRVEAPAQIQQQQLNPEQMREQMRLDAFYRGEDLVEKAALQFEEFRNYAEHLGQSGSLKQILKKLKRILKKRPGGEFSGDGVLDDLLSQKPTYKQLVTALMTLHKHTFTKDVLPYLTNYARCWVSTAHENLKPTGRGFNDEAFRALAAAMALANDDEIVRAINRGCPRTFGVNLEWSFKDLGMESLLEGNEVIRRNKHKHLFTP